MQEAYADCAALVRMADRDRYLATLLVPEPARRHILALYAFNAEVASVRERASEPLAGEIRLQWWRDLLEGKAAGDAARNPVAAASIDTVERHRLPRDALGALVEARRFDLYDDVMATLGAYEAYVRATSSSLFALATQILHGDQLTLGASDAAGLAYGMTGLLRAFSLHASRGQVYLPADVLAQFGVSAAEIVAGQDSPALRAALGAMRGEAAAHLAKARAQLADIPAVARPAFLPLALVDPYLARMERPDYEPFRTLVDVPQWRKQWKLWKAARRAP
jgi:phytoene synthase